MNFLFLGYGPIASRFIQNRLKANLNDKYFVLTKQKTTNQDILVISETDLDSTFLSNIDVILNSWKSIHDLEHGQRINLLAHISTSISKFCKFVNLSSVSIYGECSGYVNELVKPNPVNSYGSQKLEIEILLKTLDMPNTINLRVSNVYGDPYFNDFINKVFEYIKEGKVLPVDDPNSIVRDFVSVDYLIQCLSRISEVDLRLIDESYSVFNVSTGASISLSSVIAIIEEAMNRRLKYEIRQPSSEIIYSSQISNLKLQKLMMDKYDQVPSIKAYIHDLLGDTRVQQI